MSNFNHILFWEILLFIIWISGKAFPETQKKYKIESVRFQGNEVFSDKQLHKVILSQPSGFLKPFYFYQNIFEEDLKNLELFYHQYGYLEARISGQSVRKDTSNHKVFISIQIYEGILTTVEGVSIFGNKVFSDAKLEQKIMINAGDPLLRKKIDNTTVAILTMYAEHGYLNAEVKPEIRLDKENYKALIDYDIEENNQFRIDRIRIQGLEKTNSNVVKRELRFKEGEIVNYSRLLESQRRIYLTGLFESVFIRPKASISGDSTLKDILVELKEGEWGEFNISTGFGSVDKLRGKIEIYNNNLSGTARKLGFMGTISFINRTIESSFSEPWTLNFPVQTDVTLSTEYKEEPGYDLSRYGGELTFGYQFLKRSNVRLTYRQQKYALKNIKLLEIENLNNSDISSLRLSFTFDTRNNLFNATRGIYFDTGSEFGGAFAGGISNFVKMTLQFKIFYPLHRNTVVASAIAIGWMDAKGGLAKIPLHERFYAGGPNSLRGYDYQKVGPLDAKRNPFGGRVKFVWNIFEIRQTIYKIIGGTIFAEAGNIWSRPERIRFGNLRPSSGAGLRVNTPVGLVRLDYGFNLDRKTGEPFGKLYFSMGQAF